MSSVRTGSGAGGAWARGVGAVIVAMAAAACGGDGDAVPDRETATARALEAIGDDGVAELAVFVRAEPVMRGQVLAVYDDEASDGTRILATADEDAWLVYADLEPGRGYAHPGKIVLVDRDDGAAAVHDVAWWPELDGVDLWRDAASRAADVQVARDAPVAPGAAARRAGPLLATGTVPSYCTPTAIQRWALVVSGSDDAAVPKEETQALALALTARGYRVQNLAPATMRDGWDTVRLELERIRQGMFAAGDQGYCDEVTIVWSGHASRRGTLLVERPGRRRESIPMSELAAEADTVSEMVEGAQLRVAVNTCYSGHIVEALAQAIPVDAGASDPSEIVRDVLVMSSGSATERVYGAGGLNDTFTEDFTDCVRDAGVDWTTLFDCAADDSLLSSPQSRAWWATGN